MTKPTIRILVVEDYLPFCRFITAHLQKVPGFQVVGEVSDGVEAVQKARELQPDLILLDIGLPKLNGIEAARQIRTHSPRSKILFVSENRSWEIAEEALRTGATGYVVKSDAARALLPAVKAVLHGKRFISASLAGHDPNHPVGKPNTNGPCQQGAAPNSPRNIESRHEVEFYADDAAFVKGFARHIEIALGAKRVVILLATESHRADILQRLRTNAVKIDATIKQGGFIQLSAADTLAKLMVNDLPDPVRCAKVVGDLITEASEGATVEHTRIAIYGECAPTLLRAGNAKGAIRLEYLWDEITKYRADTLCGYLQSVFPEGEASSIRARICARHSAVMGDLPPG